MKNYKSMTVGEIVADNFNNAEVFENYKIDFCCHGSVPFTEACRKAGADADKVISDLERESSEVSEMVDFKSWPTDLLVDYILKFHHRRVRREGVAIAELLDKVCKAHGPNHPELYKIQALYENSMVDLENHLNKEEMVLFPYVYELCNAEMNGSFVPPFHCGSIESPIAVMMAEHDIEGERYREISELSHHYTVPEDACSSYRLLYKKLKSFEDALHHHIHLENNIVFPRALQMENDCR